MQTNIVVLVITSLSVFFYILLTTPNVLYKPFIQHHQNRVNINKIKDK